VKELLATYPRQFYARPTLAVAADLLGTKLVRRLPGDVLISGRIVEVEAYTKDDSACHAFKGVTERVKVMFGPPGHAYVYFIYGMHYCVNVVTEPEGTAGAVLIRAVDFEGPKGGRGPGRLCKTMGIDRDLYGADLCSSKSDLWISPAEKLTEEEIEVSPRVGVSSAEDKLWRFFIKNHHDVTTYRPYARKTRSAKRAAK
jgi:DNA-3-methyladenine glycosylase